MKAVDAIHGVIPALTLSLNDEGTIAFDVMERQISYLIHGGISGLFVNGTTGEGAFLSSVEKRTVLGFVRSIVGTRIPLYAVCLQPSTEAVIQEIREIEGEQPDYVTAVTPYYYPADQAVIEDHFTKIADASPVPLVVYDIPGNTGNTISAETLIALSKHPNIVGVKDSSGDFSKFCKVFLNVDHSSFACIQGDDYLNGGALLLGAPAVVTGMGNVRIEPFVRMYAAARQCDIESVRESQLLMFQMGEIFDLVHDTISCVKAGLEILGRGSRRMKLPSMTASEAQVEAIRGVLEFLGLLE
ncbi:MAG TPA: dihydrodipicolinate synthase family protein [Spirochaetia bacterium]|nr:dihydrodipicolinate synthase family protein [Spirochaetia bacterium]